MPKVRMVKDCPDINDFVALKGKRVDGTVEQLQPLGDAVWIGPPPEGAKLGSAEDGPRPAA